MRRMYLPPAWRENSQLNRAVRTPPMCKKPVGLGAKRVRTDIVGARELASYRAPVQACPSRGAGAAPLPRWARFGEQAVEKPFPGGLPCGKIGFFHRACI